MTMGLIKSEALGFQRLSQVFVSSCGDLVFVPAAIIGFYFHFLWLAENSIKHFSLEEK